MSEKVTCNGTPFINSGYLNIGCDTCRFCLLGRECCVRSAEARKKSKIGKSRTKILTALFKNNGKNSEGLECNWWAAPEKSCQYCQMFDTDNFVCLENYEGTSPGLQCNEWHLAAEFNKFIVGKK